MFTAGGDVGEALALAPFPLAVADVEVDVDRGGQSLVAIGRDLDHEAVLQRRKAAWFKLNYHKVVPQRETEDDIFWSAIYLIFQILLKECPF